MIYIGADHRGFELKEKLKEKLQSSGYEVTDMGNDHFDPQDDYVDFAYKVAQAVASQQGSRGVLLCGSGAGVDMTANKVTGIRSALVFDIPRTKQAREHEDVNVISLPSDVLSEDVAWEIVQTFLSTPFSGEERHKRRLQKLKEIDQNHG